MSGNDWEEISARKICEIETRQTCFSCFLIFRFVVIQLLIFVIKILLRGPAFVRGNNIIINTFVKFLHSVVSGIERQFRVENTTFDGELFEEEFEAVAAIYVIDEEDALPPDKLEFEDDICQEKFVDFRASGW